MTWTLVILVYAGMLAKGDSVALETLPGWSTQAACQDAGKALTKLVSGTAKELVFVCVKQ